MSKPVFIQTTREGSMPAGTVLEVASEAAAKKHYPGAKILGGVGSDEAAAAVYRARIASGEIPNPEPETPAKPASPSRPKKKPAPKKRPASTQASAVTPSAPPIPEPALDGDIRDEGAV